MSGSTNAATEAAAAALAFAQDYGLAPGGATPPEPTPQYLSYRTQPGDRWDLISWRAYGDPTLVSGLILANPTVPISPVLPQGVTILCPLIEPPASAPNSTPWSP